MRIRNMWINKVADEETFWDVKRRYRPEGVAITHLVRWRKDVKGFVAYVTSWVIRFCSWFFSEILIRNFHVNWILSLIRGMTFTSDSFPIRVTFGNKLPSKVTSTLVLMSWVYNEFSCPDFHTRKKRKRRATIFLPEKDKFLNPKKREEEKRQIGETI